MQKINKRKKREKIYGGRGLIINLILLVVSVLIVLTLFEIFLRIFPLVSDVQYTGDKKIGYKHIPNKSGVYVIPENVVNINFNREGFRDVNHEIENPKNKYRIVFLGDSFVDALQVEFKDTFYGILDRELGDKSPEKFEIFNFGMSAFSTAQEYLVYKNYAEKYNPDSVFLFVFLNDVYDGCNEDKTKPTYYIENGEVKQREFKPNEHSSLELFVAEYFKGVVFLRYTYYQYKKKEALENDKRAKIGKIEFEKVLMKEYDSKTKECWEISQYFLSELNKEVKDNGGELFVFIVPHPAILYEEDKKRFLEEDTFLDESELDFNKPQRIFEEMLEEEEINFMNLKEEFEKQEQRVYFEKDGHFNELGHEIVAEIIFEKLIKERVLN